MSKNTTKYRDLDKNDFFASGDEYKPDQGDWTDQGDWMLVPDAAIGFQNNGHDPCRRPIPEPEAPMNYRTLDLGIPIPEPESPWIPISTLPTEADGGVTLSVFVIYRSGTFGTRKWDYLANVTHWMPIPPLPDPAPTKNESLADLIVGIYDKETTAKYRMLADKKLREIVLEVLNAEEAE
tara:strand:- start:1679 stop:2218 length:540 start_codon:yes stop_codon:yes gene_type:complete